MSAAPLQLGIVGAGGAASLIAGALPDAPRVQLRACAAGTADSARRFAAPLGVPAYDTMDALLADEGIEAVYLATPNSLHHEQTHAALRAGKHVLVEKPMALLAAEAEQTMALAAELGRVVGVGFHLRHSDVFRELKDQLEGDAIGEPRLVRAAWGMPLGKLQGWKDDPARAGAGSLMGLGVHVLDLLLWLMDGDVEPVAAVSDRRGDQLDRTFLAFMAAGDCLIELAVSRDHPIGGSLSVYGTRGVRHAENALTTRAEGGLHDGAGATFVTNVQNPYATQLNAFADAVRGDGEFHADASDGARSVALTEALLSAASQEP